MKKLIPLFIIVLAVVAVIAWKFRPKKSYSDQYPPKITQLTGTGAEESVGFIGDSVTRYVPKDGKYAPPEEMGDLLHAKTGKPVTIVNCGLPGYSSAQLLQDSSYTSKALAAFEANHVKTVMICTGMNDCRPALHATAAEHHKYISDLVELFRSHGYKVILNRPPWFDAKRLANCDGDPSTCESLANSYTDDWNGDKAAYDYFKAHPEELSDSVLPNARGVHHLAEFWLKALK